LSLDSAQQSVFDSGKRRTHLVQACLLLERDAEAEALQGFFDFYVRPDEQPLYLLARSGRIGEPESAKEALALLRRKIRATSAPSWPRGRPCRTGTGTSWPPRRRRVSSF
jgi:hypothetical protein